MLCSHSLLYFHKIISPINASRARGNIHSHFTRVRSRRCCHSNLFPLFPFKKNLSFGDNDGSDEARSAAGAGVVAAGRGGEGRGMHLHDERLVLLLSLAGVLVVLQQRQSGKVTSIQLLRVFLRTILLKHRNQIQVGRGRHSASNQGEIVSLPCGGHTVHYKPDITLHVVQAESDFICELT